MLKNKICNRSVFKVPFLLTKFMITVNVSIEKFMVNDDGPSTYMYYCFYFKDIKIALLLDFILFSHTIVCYSVKH